MTTNQFIPKGAERFAGTNIVSVRQFTRDDLELIFEVAEKMRTTVDLVGSTDLLKGRLLVNLFYEPSTRTASSFAAAMHRLGGKVLQISEVHYSSVAKGESLQDTVRTLESYADAVVLRHTEAGAAKTAAEVARKPIINAGDGIGEHPTQALLDLFTIEQELGRVDGLKIALIGDLKYGRTVHSLARLLAMFNVELHFVSPESLRLPEGVRADLEGCNWQEHTELSDVLESVDVLYVTRVQKERFSDLAAYEAVKHAYVIGLEEMQRVKDDMIVMHPFPRVGEIDPAIDDDPRAAYFRQIEYGMYVRMALLAMVLGRA